MIHSMLRSIARSVPLGILIASLAVMVLFLWQNHTTALNFDRNTKPKLQQARPFAWGAKYRT